LHDTSLRPRNFEFYSWILKGNFYSPRNDAQSTIWWFNIEENFDMCNPKSGKAKFKDVIDMLIHSKVLDFYLSKRMIVVGSDLIGSNGKPFVFDFSLDKFLKCCAKVRSANFSVVPPILKKSGAKK
jgi:hypothetical protein